jgi:hypothetical protein
MNSSRETFAGGICSAGSSARTTAPPHDRIRVSDPHGVLTEDHSPHVAKRCLVERPKPLLPRREDLTVVLVQPRGEVINSVSVMAQSITARQATGISARS